jgi:hypothetical protein
MESRQIKERKITQTPARQLCAGGPSRPTWLGLVRRAGMGRHRSRGELHER